MSAPNATFNMSGSDEKFGSHLLAEGYDKEAEPKSVCSPKQNMDYRNSRMEAKSTSKRAKRKFDCLANQHTWRSEKKRNMAEDPKDPQDPEQELEFFTRAEIHEMCEIGQTPQKHIDYAHAQIKIKKYEQCKCYKCLQTNKIIDKSDGHWFKILEQSMKEFIAPNLHVQSWRDRHQCVVHALQQEQQDDCIVCACREVYQNLKKQYINMQPFLTCTAREADCTLRS